GLTADVTYTITVYAWNGQGCTTGPSVQVTPRALPPTVTEAALAGPVADGAGTWNFRVSGVGTGGGVDPAYSYMYRLVGEGVDGTASGVLSGTNSLVSGATHYGVPLAAEFRACRS